MGFAQEGYQVGDVDDRIGTAEQIEIEQRDAITVDEDMVRFEIAVDQRGRRPGQPGDHRLHHGRDVIGQVRPRGREELPGLVQPGYFLPDLSRRRVDIEVVKPRQWPAPRTVPYRRNLCPG